MLNLKKSLKLSAQTNDPFEEIRMKLRAKAEGILEGVKQTALNMIKKGYDEAIFEVTNLSLSTIKELRNSLAK